MFTTVLIEHSRRHVPFLWERGGGLKTPTAIDRRPVFLGSWTAFAKEIEAKKAKGSPRKPKRVARRVQDKPKMGPRGPREGPR